MPSVKLTVKGVEALRPGAKRVDFWDDSVTGFHLRVTPNGAKTYAVWYRVNGIARRYTIDNADEVSLEAARQRAREVIAAAGRGEDAVARRKEERLEAARRARRGQTLEDLARRCLDSIGPTLRPRSLVEYKRALEVDVFPALGKRAPEEVQRGDIRDLVREKAKAAPIQANRTLAAIRRVFNWAVREDLLPGSPCMGLAAPSQERQRQRTYTDDEIRRIIGASLRGELGDLIPFLFYTGTRSEETRAARWDEIDLARKLWTIPGEKAKARQAAPIPHPVPLSSGALRVLGRIAHAAEPWVFPAKRSAQGFMPNNQNSIAAVSAASGVADFRLHDIRRTLASRLAAKGTAPHVVDAVLGHRPPRLVRTYQVYTHEKEMRAALESWSRTLDRILSQGA